MKPENCSKEELIYFLKRRCCFHLEYLESDILEYRYEKADEQSFAALENADVALKEYTALLTPYNGKPVGDIPANVISRASAAAKAHDLYMKQFKRLDGQRAKLMGKIVVGNTVKVVRTDYISRLTKTVLDTDYFAETLTK